MTGYPRKRARTRAALVRGAMEVVGRGGMDALTVAAVTDAAGVSHGTLYNHVDGTDELAAIVADQLAAVVEQGAEFVTVASDDVGARVALGVMQLLETHVHDPVLAAAFVAAHASDERFAARVQAVVERTLLRGLEGGSLDVHDVPTTADAIIGTSVQTLRSAVRRTRVPDPAATADMCLRLLGLDREERAAALARCRAAQTVP